MKRSDHITTNNELIIKFAHRVYLVAFIWSRFVRRLSVTDEPAGVAPCGGVQFTCYFHLPPLGQKFGARSTRNGP